MSDNILKNNSSEKEIDLLELALVLWKNKKLILKVSLIGLVIGLIVAFSIPKTYTTQVSLTPDQTSSLGGGGSISALAAMTGINLNNNSSSLLTSPDLFPSMLNSTPFLMSLLEEKVSDKNIVVDTTLYAYLKKEQKSPWWSTILGFPSKLIGIFSSKSEKSDSLVLLDNSPYISLSSEENRIIEKLKSLLSISIDKKTGIIVISATMQSPEISAFMASKLTESLQEYIIKYRTQKARESLEFTQKLYDEARDNYYKKQQELATYTDANFGVISARFATTQDRLQNETSLAYTTYNQMAQELQSAKIKVQDTTPVYSILEPAVEPLTPSAPNKKMVVVGFFFLFFAFICIYVSVRDIFFKS